MILNSGSSSLKYKLFEMDTEKILCKGMIEKIGTGISIFKYSSEKEPNFEKKLFDVNSHDKAFEYIKKILLDKKTGVIKNLEDIAAIGHRVVHGGEYFKGPCFINSDVMEKIRMLIPLAPLHNGAHLSGIKSCVKLFGGSVPQVAVFDTSYYSDLPEKAYMYPVPYKYYEKYNIRKYGFHGTSHNYVTKRYEQISNKKLSEMKIISCHLGNGSSITAVKNGKVMDTSMGLTPLGGFMMGTRSGSLDPSVIFQMAEKESLSMEEVNKILHKNSGLKGISGVCSDDRKILDSEIKGNKRAKLAHEMMVYQITKFIGGYIAVLGGCDALIFTGGIGENQWIHREKICKNFEYRGLKLDTALNSKIVLGKEGKISKENSSADIFVIPTNEELAIARETKAMLTEKHKTEVPAN